MIPQIIHFVWIGPAMPDWAERNIAQFGRLNPDHRIIVHDQTALTGELADLGAQLAHPSSVADLVRLQVLARDGGWYFDMDTWPLRPLADAERAFGVGESGRVLVPRQDHNRYPVNNCMIAAAPNAPGLWALIEAVLAERPNGRRTQYGPDLFTRVVRERAGLFVAADPPWFCPCRHDRAWQYYQLAVHGHEAPLRRLAGGQLPFSIHLWLNGRPEEIDRAFASPPETRAYAMVERAPPEHCMSGAAEAIAAMGYRVSRYEKMDMEAVDRQLLPPAILVMWNNIRRAKVYDTAVAAGARALVMEMGFLDRSRHVQLDPVGFLHRASWAADLRADGPLPDLPACAAERLAGVWGEPLRPVRPRAAGPVLVIGQVPGDSQMVESAVNTPRDIAKLVASHLPAGVPAVFRGHPKASLHANHLAGQILPVSEAADLKAAIKAARFVVTINSNAAVEAMAWGCPVLALGPSLYLRAGLARAATPKTFRSDLAAMLEGWAPDTARAAHYLRLLACRQFSRADLAAGGVLAALLAGADPMAALTARPSEPCAAGAEAAA